MKTIKTTCIFSLLATSFLHADLEGREIRFSSCPKEVRQTIRANDRGGMISEVEVYQTGTGTVYTAEVELPRDRDITIYVRDNGRLIKVSEDISRRSLPEAVRDTLRGFSGRVDDVDKETLPGGGVRYQIEIDRVGKRDLHLLVDPSGKVIDQSTGDDPFEFGVTRVEPSSEREVMPA